MFRDVEPLATPLGRPEGTAGKNAVAVIGIDRYQSWPRLDNAVTDARGVLAAFVRMGFEPIEPVLIDGAATADAMRRLVTEQFTKLRETDSLVVFFAGHGHTQVRTFADGESIKTGYIVPFDGDPPDVSISRWIRLDSWLSDIARLSVKHVLVFLDACHSGIALGSLIKSRGAAPDRSSLKRLQDRRSRRVITSALDDERALDSGPVPGHSLFTGCLLSALDGELAPHGALVTGSQLGLHLQRRVSAYTHAAQTPDFGALEEDRRGELVLRVVTTDRAADPASGAVTQSMPSLPESCAGAPRMIRVLAHPGSTRAIDWVRCSQTRTTEIEIQISRRPEEQRPPAIRFGNDEVASSAAAGGVWWTTVVQVVATRHATTAKAICVADEPKCRARLLIVSRDLFGVALTSLLFVASLSAYVLCAVFGARPALDYRIAASGVPILCAAGAVRGALAPRLRWRGVFQLPGYLLLWTAFAVALALLPSVSLVVVENRSDAVVRDNGIAIEPGHGITATEADLASLSGAYCMTPPVRSAGSLVELVLPAAKLFGERRRWNAFSGLTKAERQSLRVRGGRVFDAVDESTFILLDSCIEFDASASLEVEGATVHVPFDWELARERNRAGAAAWTLHAGRRPGALASGPVISAPGELRCAHADIAHPAHTVVLQRWLTPFAAIDDWTVQGAVVSDWRGGSSVGWACLAGSLDSSDSVMHASLTAKTTDLSIELPFASTRAAVALDGVSINCIVPGPGWVIRRAMPAAHSVALVSLVSIPIEPGVAQLAPAAAGQVVYCGPGGDHVFDVDNLRIRMSAAMTIERRPVARHFCFYVDALATQGPCRGNGCPAGCWRTRDALRELEPPSKACTSVCECKEVPRCEP